MHFFVCPAPCVIHCIDECILVQPEALIQHAPEMGRSDRRAVVVISAPAVGRYEFQCTGRSQFSNFLHTSGSFDKIPPTFDDEFAKDVRQQKFWEVSLGRFTKYNARRTSQITKCIFLPRPLVVYETGKCGENPFSRE